MNAVTLTARKGTAMNWLKKHGHWLLTLYVAFVFIQSLFFSVLIGGSAAEADVAKNMPATASAEAMAARRVKPKERD